MDKINNKDSPLSQILTSKTRSGKKFSLNPKKLLRDYQKKSVTKRKLKFMNENNNEEIDLQPISNDSQPSTSNVQPSTSSASQVLLNESLEWDPKHNTPSFAGKTFEERNKQAQKDFEEITGQIEDISDVSSNVLNSARRLSEITRQHLQSTSSDQEYLTPKAPNIYDDVFEENKNQRQYQDLNKLKDQHVEQLKQKNHLIQQYQQQNQQQIEQIENYQRKIKQLQQVQQPQQQQQPEIKQTKKMVNWKKEVDAMVPKLENNVRSFIVFFNKTDRVYALHREELERDPQAESIFVEMLRQKVPYKVNRICQLTETYEEFKELSKKACNGVEWVDTMVEEIRNYKPELSSKLFDIYSDNRQMIDDLEMALKLDEKTPQEKENILKDVHQDLVKRIPKLLREPYKQLALNAKLRSFRELQEFLEQNAKNESNIPTSRVLFTNEKEDKETIELIESLHKQIKQMKVENQREKEDYKKEIEDLKNMMLKKVSVENKKEENFNRSDSRNNSLHKNTYNQQNERYDYRNRDYTNNRYNPNDRYTTNDRYNTRERYQNTNDRYNNYNNNYNNRNPNREVIRRREVSAERYNGGQQNLNERYENNNHFHQTENHQNQNRNGYKETFPISPKN